ETGQMTAERVRIPTPQPSTPQAVAKVIADLVNSFDLPEKAPIGIAFPAPIDHGVVRFIANLDQSWKGVNLPELVKAATGHPVFVINDADAAGFAEQRYGAAKGKTGTVLVTTLGTGIGSALIVDGVLVPNTELGHLEIDGHDAESQAADSARDRENLTMEEWAKRLQKYFETVEMLLSPDLIVVGGGVSKKHQEFLPLLHLRAPIIPAELFNSAGIVGAAAYAAAERKHLKALKKAAENNG
ncbi:MAG: ROK family protein, partial [Promicromonosporaceae bacterium]|nr:ROK family protein [Promicromonosporaceae bacterium]